MVDIEIQDILKQNKGIQTVHDEEAAVNYFTFDKDQWVSYDDKKTFDQKVKWADSIGLGGIMIWAVDLDDKDFTALAGLTGQPVSKGLDVNKKRLQHLQQESWSSDNGTGFPQTDQKQSEPADISINRSGLLHHRLRPDLQSWIQRLDHISVKLWQTQVP